MRPGLVSTLTVLFLLSSTSGSARIAKRYHARRSNELSGGLGFAVDLNAFTPGGFKWFNDYGHHLGGPAWINVQLNLTAGEGGRCYWHHDDVWVCDQWRGSGMEVGLGVKLKWRARRSPVQIHTKLGPAVELVWFDDFHGTALVFRGGVGVRYFVLPELSFGGEIAAAVGPIFSRYDSEVYAAVDANFGVEYQF
jgi:hypothetical protein